MPSFGGASKGKGKGREGGRRSRSRNTTPSSVLSGSTAITGPSYTAYLETDTSKLLVSTSSQSAEIIERLGSTTGVLDPAKLESLLSHVKELSQSAEDRSSACDQAMRNLRPKIKDTEQEEEQERLERESEQRKAKMKRESHEDDDDTRGRKAGKVKKGKDRSSVREERPLTHGAHGVARQDGLDVKPEEDPARSRKRTPAALDSPSPAKKAKQSPGTSSLSEAQSPETAVDLDDKPSPAKSDVSMDSSIEDHQPPPAAPVISHAFFPDPMAYDPTVYHIRDVASGMMDEEKKEIYSVAKFPTKDLADQIAGTPPDKDFSNAKPTNQVSANTFATYIEPYVRPLVEEDVAFLREKGDRTTPFVSVPRGKKHYTEIWAEEDGSISVDSAGPDRQKLPPNQPRGSIDEISDETATTDHVSAGPLTNRLLSLFRFEHRTPPGENTTNGLESSLPNGDTSMELDGPSGLDTSDKPPASATAFSDAANGTSNSATSTNKPTAQTPKLDYLQHDERLKLELRHLGLLAPEDVPEYDGHHDDDISERLRILQAELRKTMIANGARKARLLEIAKERMAFQEYSTIHEDLDSQVQQAYLKRTRTLGKSKKGGQHGKPRPGGAGGGSHIVSAAGGNLARQRDIGDLARQLMDRRRRWADCIGPVFEGMQKGVPGKETSLWDPAVMEAYEKAEIEGFDEEAE